MILHPRQADFVLCLRKTTGGLTSLEPHWDEAEQKDHEQDACINTDLPDSVSWFDWFNFYICTHNLSFSSQPCEDHAGYGTIGPISVAELCPGLLQASSQPPASRNCLRAFGP